MPKLKFARTASLLFVVTSFIIFSACRAHAPWVKISDVSFRFVKYDGAEHTIWLVKDLDNAVYRLARPNDDFSFGSAERIATPNDSRINDICASNGVWVSGFTSPAYDSASISGSPTYMIFRFSDKTKSWQTIGVTDGIAPCKSLRNGDVVFWNHNKIIHFKLTDTQPQYINTDWEISYITDDLDGNLWISTVNGEIYKQSESNWTLVDTLGAKSYPRLFVDNSGNLWVSSNDKNVFKYSAFNSTFHRKKVFESSLGFSQNFFQDSSDTIWLVTNNRLLVQREEQFQEVELPSHSGSLGFGAFDSQTNTLFVETEKGTFALDLDKYSP